MCFQLRPPGFDGLPLGHVERCSAVRWTLRQSKMRTAGNSAISCGLWARHDLSDVTSLTVSAVTPGKLRPVGRSSGSKLSITAGVQSMRRVLLGQ